MRTAPPEVQLAFLRARGAASVEHSEADLLGHLTGTHDLLVAWGARPALATAGLFHSVYGTETVEGGLGLGPDDRAAVAAVVGDEAEALAWLFGRASTGSVLAAGAPGPGEAGPAAVADHATGEDLPVTDGQLTDLCELTVANLFEQRARLPLAYQDAMLAEAQRVRHRLSPGAGATLDLALEVEPDDRAFRRWVGSSHRTVHVDLGGGPPPPSRFEPATVLADSEAVSALRDLADHLRARAWDHGRDDDVRALLALGVPVDTEAVVATVGAGAVAALERSTALGPNGDRLQLGLGLMRLGDTVVAVPRETSRPDPVYLGFEALLLSPLLSALGVEPRVAVDLGTGAGLVAALLARHRGAAVVATDLDPRATAMAHLALLLARTGGEAAPRGGALVADVAAGLRSRSVDLVTANPPLVPTGGDERRPVFAAGGVTGTELPLRFLREGVELLAPGGTFTMLTLDSTLVDGRRPVHEALDALRAGPDGGDLDVMVLSTHHNGIRPSYVPRLLREHADQLADTVHAAVVVRRAGPTTRPVADAYPALAGLGWRDRTCLHS